MDLLEGKLEGLEARMESGIGDRNRMEEKMTRMETSKLL